MEKKRFFFFEASLICVRKNSFVLGTEAEETEPFRPTYKHNSRISDARNQCSRSHFPVDHIKERNNQQSKVWRLITIGNMFYIQIMFCVTFDLVDI